MIRIRTAFGCFLCLFVLSVTFANQKMLVRIYTQGVRFEKRLPRGLDIAGGKRGEWIDVVIAEEELATIWQSGFEIEILSHDIEALERQLRGFYHDYPDFVDSLEAIATNNPLIARLDTIGTSWEGREILCLKISDNVGIDESEPEILIVGLHHAREWPSLEICLFCADTLTRAYGGDPDVTQIVDSREVWIVPCMNPDGYIWCHDEGHDWRKNRRYFPEFGTYGVDLNRNYDGSNDGNPLGEWGSIPGGTSHGPSSSVYCGPSPCSETETQAIRDLILVHDFIFGVAYHTHGEAVIWSWGYTTLPTPDAATFSSIGHEMASRITRQSGSGTYDAYQSSVGLYSVSGDFDDWSYGFSLYCGGKNLISYTVETCASYHPSESYLDQIVRENFDGAFYLCEIADSIADLLTPRVMPPEISEVDTSYTGTYTVIWSQKNPPASPDYYQLDELSGFTVLLDDAESGTGLWETVTFSVNGSRYHSPTHSFFSNLSSGNEASAMTTISPFPVAAGDSLSFWCWYDIEPDYDYAYAEVSLDGRKWDILDEFTGDGSQWTRKAYSLEDYAGHSIFIRFRYITDDWYEYEGFYVDDIHPVPDFNTITTLSSDIADTTYLVDSSEPGDYCYRVRGYNDPRGWGDWSQLEDVVVMGADSLIVESDTLMEGETQRVIPIIGVNRDTIAGYSLTLCYDTTVLSIDSLTLEGTRGEGALYFEWKDSLDCVTADVIYSSSPPYIPPGSGVMIKIVVDVNPNPSSDTTFINLTEGSLGDSLYTVLVDGVFVILPMPDQFIRGDADGSGGLTLGDGLWCFRCQFVPGWPDSCKCQDATDADDNGTISIGDCLRILRKQFVPGWQDSIPPPCCNAPGDCGSDPTEDELGCQSHPCQGIKEASHFGSR